MDREIKQCQNCKSEFAIEPEDFLFYEKIHVPPPTWCPECRLKRRLVLRNERTLYKRDCDLCGESIISMYSKGKPFPVYCPNCWHSDKWDPLFFGRDIDINKSFFQQFKNLQNNVPRPALFNFNSINSEYNNYSLNNKNCYLSFRIAESENCYYSYYCLSGKDSIGSLYVHKSELLNSCFNAANCYKCHFLVDCENCFDTAYSYDLKNCSHCLFSCNLRNKQYHIKNKRVSPEEFQRAWNEIISGSRIKKEEAEKNFYTIYKNNAIHRYNNIIKSYNSRGASLTNCKNVFEVYYGNNSENVRYGDDVETTRDSMDVKGPMESELVYDGCSIDYGCSRIYFSSFCQKGSINVYYSSFCINSQDLFGCISLKNEENCILNKKYSSGDYEDIKNKLINLMKERGEFGEGFPIEISPFAYNETVAMEYFPLDKEKAIENGYDWEENLGGTYNQETIKQENIPDLIKNVPDSITNEILKCVDCGKNYRITSGELLLYRRLLTSLPDQCMKCCYYKFLQFRPVRHLWHRKCQCAGIQSDNGAYKNTIGHFHGTNHCENEFETTYSPDRPEIVYCEACYNQEVA